jgi:hypothetical protein
MNITERSAPQEIIERAWEGGEKSGQSDSGDVGKSLSWSKSTFCLCCPEAVVVTIILQRRTLHRSCPVKHMLGTYRCYPFETVYTTKPELSSRAIPVLQHCLFSGIRRHTREDWWWS